MFTYNTKQQWRHQILAQRTEFVRGNNKYDKIPLRWTSMAWQPVDLANNKHSTISSAKRLALILLMLLTATEITARGCLDEIIHYLNAQPGTNSGWEWSIAAFVLFHTPRLSGCHNPSARACNALSNNSHGNITSIKSRANNEILPRTEIKMESWNFASSKLHVNVASGTAEGSKWKNMKGIRGQVNARWGEKESAGSFATQSERTKGKLRAGQLILITAQMQVSMQHFMLLSWVRKEGKGTRRLLNAISQANRISHAAVQLHTMDLHLCAQI